MLTILGQPPSAQDDAMHLFYDQSEDDFRALALALLELQTDVTADPATPLWIHPGLADEDANGPTHAALAAIVVALRVRPSCRN